jgi:hypothetical protein
MSILFPERKSGWGIITEPEFRTRLESVLSLPEYAVARSVTGPGRSGAVAAVYASHWLGIPFIPHGHKVPDCLTPILVVDTAAESGATLRKAMRKAGTEMGVALFHEPPRVRFWYENRSPQVCGLALPGTNRFPAHGAEPDGQIVTQPPKGACGDAPVRDAMESRESTPA